MQKVYILKQNCQVEDIGELLVTALCFVSFVCRCFRMYLYQYLTDLCSTLHQSMRKESQFLPLGSRLLLLYSTNLSSDNDKRIQYLASLSVFFCLSYFQFLTMYPSRVSFLLDNQFGNPELSRRSKFFVWTTVLNLAKTNGMLQKCKPLTALFPGMCVICCSSSESVSHLLLHCSAKNYLWIKAF